MSKRTLYYKLMYRAPSTEQSSGRYDQNKMTHDDTNKPHDKSLQHNLSPTLSPHLTLHTFNDVNKHMLIDIDIKSTPNGPKLMDI
jgi:hypothetical protein